MTAHERTRDEDSSGDPASGASGRRIPDVKSAVRTLEVLEVLGSGARHSLAELSTRLDLPKSSLHGILRTMHRHGWVETDETGTRYSLGIKALRVGSAYVESDDVVTAAGVVLDGLVAHLDETVHLGRLDGGDIVYLAKRESTQALRMFSAVGRRLPAHTTALGKAVLATLPQAQVDRQLSWPLTRLTPRTVCDADTLHAELEAVRTRGYAVDREENSPGITCFAAAIAWPRSPLNALSCSVPTVRLDRRREEEVVAAVLEAAAAVSSRGPRVA